MANLTQRECLLCFNIIEEEIQMGITISLDDFRSLNSNTNTPPAKFFPLVNHINRFEVDRYLCLACFLQDLQQFSQKKIN